MTRIANVAKAGFFPTGDEIVDLIQTWISAPTGGRILDPCAANGEALIPLAKQHNLTPYGVELHEGRARTLRQRIDKELPEIDLGRQVISDSFYALNQRFCREAFNLVYCNPPYLITEEGRAEYGWLRETRPLIQPGGLLVYVIPRHMLYFEKTAPYLCTWYEDIEIVRFPDPHYDRFKQVVVFATRRESSVKPDIDQVRQIRTMGQPIQAVDIPVLTETESPYLLPAPPANQDSFAFRSVHVDIADVVEEHHNIGVFHSTEFQEIINPQAAITKELRPLMPMKIGHLIGVIAAGFLNNHVLEKDGQRLLIKGTAFKERQTTEETTAIPEDEKGRTSQTTFTSTDRVITSITTMNAEGKIRAYQNNEMQDFLSEWLPAITQAVTEQYPPLYNFDYNGYEPSLNKLNLGRMIPIVNRPGLLPTQKHVIAAIATLLETKKDALIDGEMGTGKTIMGAAVPAIMAAKGIRMKHIFILCPPHLVDKWQREIKHVWPKASTMTIASRADVDTFFAHPGPIFGVMKETTARAGSGWVHAYNYMGTMVTKPRTQNQRLTILKSGPFLDPKKPIPEYRMAAVQALAKTRFIRCPKCNAKQTDKDGVPYSHLNFANAKLSCSRCDSPLYMDSRRRTDKQGMTQFKTYEWRGNNPDAVAFGHDANLGYAKYPLATYIKRKYKGMIDMLIADECHQYKAADSDRGYAYHRLAVSAKKILNLTGTSYGGKASTLFSLLYRSASDMRHAYDHVGDDGLRKWLDDYGIMQEITEVKFDEHGMESGNARSNTRVRELPGNSPAILPWLLNRAAFVSLKDLGIALPEYEEIPIGVQMEPEQAVAYDQFETALTHELAERLQHKDKSLLGAYLQALLSWPDSPWRAKRVVDKRKLAETGDLDEATVAAVDALPDDHLYPKEAKIVKLIKEERAAGRRSLLLCQQTSTLDITPQWVAMLSAAGLKAEVLKVEPSKREAWVKKAVERGVDVIITHPKRVETGLDLLDFPTIIWMGTEYSVYTILQASRRAWRIGQHLKAKVYFFYYIGTLQEQAVYLIAAKVKAAIRMRGDTIADDSLADMDSPIEDDMVSALTKIMLGSSKTAAKVTSLEDMYAEINKGSVESEAVVGGFDVNAIRNDFGAEAEEIPAAPIIIVPIPDQTKQPVVLVSTTAVTPEGVTRQKHTRTDGKRLVFGAPNNGWVDEKEVDKYLKPEPAQAAAPSTPEEPAEIIVTELVMKPQFSRPVFGKTVDYGKPKKKVKEVPIAQMSMF